MTRGINLTVRWQNRGARIKKEKGQKIWKVFEYIHIYIYIYILVDTTWYSICPAKDYSFSFLVCPNRDDSLVKMKTHFIYFILSLTLFCPLSTQSKATKNLVPTKMTHFRKISSRISLFLAIFFYSWKDSSHLGEMD